MNPDTGAIKLYDELTPEEQARWMELTEPQKASLERFSEDERQNALKAMRQFSDRTPTVPQLEKELHRQREEQMMAGPRGLPTDLLKPKDAKAKKKAKRRQEKHSRRRNRGA